MYCIDIKNGKIVWKFNKNFLFECLLLNNCVNIIESGYYNSLLFLYKLDLRTGSALKVTAFNNNLVYYKNNVIDGKLYTYTKQKDNICYEIIDVDTHEVSNAVEITSKSQLIKVFTNHLLIRDDFKKEHILVNLETNQITPFENCSNFIFSIENQFFFYNYKDKLLECHVTTGDL